MLLGPPLPQDGHRCSRTAGQARARLRALGGRPRRPAVLGPEPAGQEAAAPVAQGARGQKVPLPSSDPAPAIGQAAGTMPGWVQLAPDAH